MHASLRRLDALPVAAVLSLLLLLLLPFAVLTAVPDAATEVRPLLVGAKAPAFTLYTADGGRFAFDPDNAQKPLLIGFYRGGWCPYCNAQLMGMRRIEAELLEKGYQLVFASADSVATLRAGTADMTQDGEDAPGYTLASDASMAVAEAFGVAFRVDDATVARYREHGIDLEAASGYDHHVLPAPAVFLIDTDGVVRFSYVNPDYRWRVDPRLLLTAADVVLTQKPLQPVRRGR